MPRVTQYEPKHRLGIVIRCPKAQGQRTLCFVPLSRPKPSTWCAEVIH